MTPKGLKIGDTFEDMGRREMLRYRVIGFDGQGNYIAKLIENEVEEVKDEPIPVEEFIQEELPFTMPDDELVEKEQPVVEEVKEVKKTAPKKTATKKKTTAKKTSKK